MEIRFDVSFEVGNEKQMSLEIRDHLIRKQHDDCKSLADDIYSLEYSARLFLGSIGERWLAEFDTLLGRMESRKRQIDAMGARLIP